ncbi:MAG: HAD family phosphatase [Candidatus Nanohaloarchaea archaeon]|nr:HAD family phosphatase [Candidatus Nanohaloarchaea archaeon]
MEAVIFDMDGVIVDSEQYWHRLERQVFEEALKDADFEEVLEKATGRNYLETYELLREEYGIDMEREEFMERYDEAAEVIYGERVELMDGFRSLVEELKAEEIKIGLVSSSPRRWIGMVFDRFDLEGLLDVVASTEDIEEEEGKPEPDIYLHAAEKLEVEPEQCVAVEDSENGVKAAENAGMYCIGYRNETGQADVTVGSPRELRETLLDLEEGKGF